MDVGSQIILSNVVNPTIPKITEFVWGFKMEKNNKNDQTRGFRVDIADLDVSKAIVNHSQVYYQWVGMIPAIVVKKKLTRAINLPLGDRL